MFDLTQWLVRYGYDSAKEATIRQLIPTWLAWYQGYIKELHDYRYYNGVDYITARKRTLCMAKVISEDWANLLLNEHVTISTDEAWQERLDEILSNNAWYYRANKEIELTFALGTGAFV